MKFGWADPPYLGQARKRYGREEVDHKALLLKLLDEYPDGWVLSCSSPSLHDILPLCPFDVRIAAWVKPFCAFKVNVNPAYTWEPVLFRGGRKRTRRELTVKDHLIESMTLKKGLCGTKPPRYCRWILNLLGFQTGDAIDELYPGLDPFVRVVHALDAR